MRLYPRLLVVAGLLLAVGLACSIGRGTPPPVSEAPVVTLTSPLPGQTLPIGEPVLVNSTTLDAEGVQRVELWVDYTLVRVDVNPNGDSPYVVSQQWQSDVPGAHVIVVKAFDTQRQEGQSQPVSISLGAAAQVVPTAPPTPDEGGITPSATAAPPTRTPTLETSQPTETPAVMCTPPPCQTGEVYYCPDDCPNGCGTQCATPTPKATPPDYEPTDIEPLESLRPVWEKPEVKDYLGYPTETGSDDRQYARQYFERGYLYWWDQPDGPGLIWVVEIPQPAAAQGIGWTGPYEDTWEGGDPYVCDAARANPNGPVRGFGKLWCDRPEIAEGIGAARAAELGTGASTDYGVVQFFQGGVMLYSPLEREVWVLFDGGTWQRHPR